MPLKLRLQRHGKKGKPFYWLVAADSRAKRDGRYLEKIGTYNPNTNPATVIIDIDRAVEWLEKGAQPTDTARTLLSYKGVMLKHHLNGGVRKGAITQEIADKKLADWLKEKEAKIQTKKDNLLKTGGTLTGSLTAQTILPSADSTYNLGADGTEFANAFVDTVTSTELKTEGVTVNDNLVTASRSNDNLQLDATGTGAVEMIPAKILMANLPTSDPSVAGQLWRDGTDLKISTG